jgi:clan AA aspartic protease (TIGR02281 family)
MPNFFRLLLLLILTLPSLTDADIYRWKDKHGDWHFADELDKVPSRYRNQAEREEIQDVPQGSIPIKEDLPPPQKEETMEADADSADALPETRQYIIPYKQSPGVLYVDVSINDRSPIPMILDTGATFTVLSRSTAERLDISLKGVLPRIRTTTANGTTSNYLVRLSSVQVGDARVENVAALIPVQNNIGENGLLGQNFLNEFEWANDTTLNRLTLKEATSLPGEEIYGGHGKTWWEKKFEAAKDYLNTEQEILQAMKDYDVNGPMEQDYMDQLIQTQEANVDFFKEELGILDNKANRAMVPRSWR